MHQSERQRDVTGDLICAGCGYLLRGLDTGGRCPECNLTIAESIEAAAARPKGRALRMLSIGALALLVAVALYPVAIRVAYAQWVPQPSIFRLNRDGVRHALVALLSLPAAWALMRASQLSLSEPDSDRASRLPLILACVLLVLATVMFCLYYSVTPPGHAVLISSYAIAPVVEAVEIIVLLEMMARTARRMLPTLPRWWLRVPQWAYGVVLLLDAVPGTVVNVARVLRIFDVFTPAKDSHLPAGWHEAMQPIYRSTYQVGWLLHIATILSLASYIILIVRHGRLARP